MSIEREYKIVLQPKPEGGFRPSTASASPSTRREYKLPALLDALT